MKFDLTSVKSLEQLTAMRKDFQAAALKLEIQFKLGALSGPLCGTFIVL